MLRGVLQDMRTAQKIEERAEQASTQPTRSKRKMHPNSIRNLKPQPWPKGMSGNPGGKPGYDVAAKIARQVFALNEKEIYEGMASGVIAGNAYTFDVVANRGYGKLKETVVHEGLEVLADRLNEIRKKKNASRSS